MLFQSLGVEDLQSFVTIALATAVGGEDDLTKDKLSNLRTVGSGFRALIYELPHTTKPTSLLTQVYVGEQACASVTEPDIKTQIVSQIDTKTLLLIEAIGEHNNDGSHTTTEEAVNEYDIVEHGLGLELPLNESSDEYDSDRDNMYYYHSASSSDQEDMLTNNSANQGNNDQEHESASEANKYGDQEEISPVALVNIGSDENLSSSASSDQELDMPLNEFKSASESNSDEDIMTLFDVTPSNRQEDDMLSILKLESGEPVLNDSCSGPENEQEVVLSCLDPELPFADKPSSHEQKDEFSDSQIELKIEPKIRWRELLEICRTLWEFLKTTPNLPDLMVYNIINVHACLHNN